jgi:pyruvate dehydrogenase E2 component (dihydrolipoamide acetyltransferase)
MRRELLMPHLSDDVDEGVVVTWFVEPGARVDEGALVAEVQVEKVSQEVYAPARGHITELLVPPGSAVAQGAVIAVIDDEVALEPRPPAPAAGTSAASPAARRVGRELGVDLTAVKGSGPGGRIVEEDVRAAAALPTVAPVGEALSPTRRVIADRLRTWLSATAQLTLTTEADVTALADTLATREGGGALLATVVRACSLALQRHRMLGARLVDGRVVEPETMDIGIAVATDDGVVVPVVRSADQKDLATLQTEIAEFARRARSRVLTNAETSGAVFTVTNLGGYGIDTFTPLLDPPQVAILGIGRARLKPRVVDGAVVARTVMALSLTIDHQVIDGAPGAAFLASVVAHLEDHPAPPSNSSAVS